ncbi:hypothetical protein AB0L75_21290 [Streptomyces sp. NPDC052101]|uniref:hypothetical protein n=1 Tax=Streptomyces sp. NPDC052101 TaxID=3155763 RepID=UPI003446E914
MSADRENHDMAQTDIAFLLADAADEVEIGIAPVQAVIRGGRRRRARRWAVAAATALVLAGSTGATLAVTGLPGAADRPSTVAAQPSTPEARHVYVPQVTEVAHGSDHGTGWRVVVSVWGAPRDKAEAAAQVAAMRKYGIEKNILPGSRDLVGKTSHYSGLYYGDAPLRSLIFGTDKKWEPLSDGELMSGAVPLAKGNSDGPERLVAGAVATSTRHVMCSWKDGTSTVVVPRRVAGSPVNWFACAAPRGTSYQNAEVIP